MQSYQEKQQMQQMSLQRAQLVKDQEQQMRLIRHRQQEEYRKILSEQTKLSS